MKTHIIIAIISFGLGVVAGKWEEKPIPPNVEIPTFITDCTRDMAQWSVIKEPAPQIQLSPEQFARALCLLPAVRKGYEDHWEKPGEHAQDTIRKLSQADVIVKGD